MNALYFTILIFVASTSIALINGANQCYYCDKCPIPFTPNATNITGGVTVEKCANSNYDCVTIERKGSSFTVTSRACKKTCTSGSANEDGIKVTTSCCHSDLCNDSTSNLKMKINEVHSIFAFILVSVVSVLII